MATNTFITPSFVQDAANEAALLLYGNIVTPALVSRDIERMGMIDKSGGSVTIRLRPTLSGNLEETSKGATTLAASNYTETSVEVDLTKYVWEKVELKTHEATFNARDFTYHYSEPAIGGIAQQIELFFLRRISGGFARNMSGTAGSAPVNVADIMAARKMLLDNNVPQNARKVGILGTTAESNFLQIDNFVRNDYGTDSALALTEALLTRRYGIDWYMSQNSGTFSQGDVAGTVLGKGAVSAAATTFTLDGFTNATGIVREGTSFTVSGDTTVYTLTADIDKVGNELIVPAGSFTTAAGGSTVVTGWADNAAVTFETAHTQDVIYVPNAVAGAILAPAPLPGAVSATGSFTIGDVTVSVRLTFHASTDTSSGAISTVLYDTFIGCQVIRDEMGVIVQA